MFNALMAQAGIGDPYDIRKSSDPTEPLQVKYPSFFFISFTLFHYLF
jgi:hypothetical protein